MQDHPTGHVAELRGLVRPGRRFVAVAAVGLVAALLGGLSWNARAPRPRASPANTSTPTPSVPPSSPSFPSLPQLSGTGPFVIMFEDETTYALDTATGKRSTLSPWDASIAETNSEQVWGRAVSLRATRDDDGAIGLLRHERAPVEPPFTVRGRVLHALANPEGDALLALTSDSPEGQGAMRLILFAEGRAPKEVAEVPRTPPWEDADFTMTPMVWLPGGGWLAQPTCDCDYGSNTTGWYRITAEGKVSREAWLPYVGRSASPSSDGRLLAYADVPVRGCGENDICPDGPIRVFVADLVGKKIRRLATFRNDLDRRPVVLSPDGSRVAMSFGGEGTLRILETTSGRSVAVVRYKLEELTALALVDNQTMIAKGTESIGHVSRDVLLLVHLQSPRAKVTRLASGDITFAGWLR